MKAASLPLVLAAMSSAAPIMAQSALPAVRSGTFKTDDGVLLPGSGTIIGTPIALHNYLHFKQAADKLHSDFVATQRQDGGKLTPAHDAELRERYIALTQQIQNWIKTAND